MTSFSEEGDSGTKLQIKMKYMRLQGKQIHASIAWITHIQQMINKGRTETAARSNKGIFGGSRYQPQGCESLVFSQLFTHLNLQCIE